MLPLPRQVLAFYTCDNLSLNRATRMADHHSVL
jgi:hypothetical protein